MSALAESLQSTVPAWLDMLRHAGWPPMLLALAYALMGGWLTLMSMVRGHVGGDDGFRRAAGVALLGLAFVTLLALDQLWIATLRELSQRQGWYADRKTWQAAALTGTALLAAVGGLRARSFVAGLDDTRRRLLAGLAAPLLVTLLRCVSHHDTDRWLGLRLAGITAGRWVEWLALAWIAAITVRGMRADDAFARV